MKIYILFIVIILQGLYSYGQVPTVERNALIALYNATDGPNWTFNGLWTSTQPVTNWFGVDVENISGQDHVTGIYLVMNGLSGHIPSEISDLTYLRGLDLSGNHFPGSIQIALFGLVNLEDLSLDACLLSGIIPEEMGNLTNLINLSLVSNQLTGSIPSEIGNLSNLSIMDFRDNQLSNSIPIEIGNLMNIEGIALSYNEFSGELDLSNLINLHGLYLENNDFSLLNVRNGNNTNFDFFNISNNPNLTCVFVDNASWSETNWPNIDPTSTYVETQAECDALGINDVVSVNNIRLFPNPTSSFVNIETNNNIKIIKIKIYSVLGKLIETPKYPTKIDMTDFPQGVYYIELVDETYNQLFYKIIKE